VGAGPRNEAKKLIGLVDVFVRTGSYAEEGDHARIERLEEHGLTRNVDMQLRQVVGVGPDWDALAPECVVELVEQNRGLEVLLGSHRSGHVREAVVTSHSEPPLPGVARMLAQRAIDGVPTVAEAAQSSLHRLFQDELASGNDGRMPTNVEKAARELVGLTKSVTLCPTQLLEAVELFNARVGRYSRRGARDHHRHDLRETDRRSQLLIDLHALSRHLEDAQATRAVEALIDFYERSMVPAVRVQEEGDNVPETIGDTPTAG